jgi:two-component sensor histidine kinase/putative methionine-R-sulfoxide reductase with GAF domain
MSPSSRILALERISQELREWLGTSRTADVLDGAGLQEAFASYGAAVSEIGVGLEDAMSVAVEELQAVFQNEASADATTQRIAGIALAAVARAYLTHEPPAISNSSAPAMPSQVARLSALHQINRAATANLRLDEMLDTVVRLVADTTESDACEVFLFDESTGLLALRAAIGLNPSSVNAATIRLGSGITGVAAMQRRVVAAPDARRHADFLAHPGIGDEIYTSQVSVPIVLTGPDRLIGILNIHSIHHRNYDLGELEFLETVAGELAISIENARQYSNTDERLRQKVSQLATLQHVSRMLTSTLELSDVLRLVSEQAVELVNAEAAAMFRMAPTSNRRGQPAQPVIEHRVGVIREILEPSVRDDLARDVIERGAARQSEVRYSDGTSTLLCLPLRTAREPVGALCLRFPKDQLPDEDTIGMLQAFCDTAAMAVENAQLYQDAMHSVQTQSALVQEMHHRVRNNLQTVAALLSLQLRTAADAPWSTAIREAISRIQSIAAVHDLLSDEQRLGGTTLDVIARLVAEDAHSTLIPDGLKVEFRIEPSTLRIPTRQATIISLLINELAANAISHGFEHRTTGQIRISGWEAEGWANIEVVNNGEGVPAGFDPTQSSGLGMRITQRLVTSDLRGDFTIASGNDMTRALIRFPIAEEDPSMEAQA